MKINDRYDRYPRKGQKYTLFLKPFSEIKAMAPQVDVDEQLDRTNIHHTTGLGGGLPLKTWFIKKYCGTGLPLNLRFSRQTNDRYLYETCDYPDSPPFITLYGEWLEESPSPRAFLENDLFEI